MSVKELLDQMEEFKAMIEEVKAAAEEESSGGVTKLQATVTTAYIIASADGTTSATELSHINERLGELTGGEVDDASVTEMLGNAAAYLASEDRDSCIQGVCGVLDTEADRKAAFMVAANVSWTGGGIGTKEGLALQAVSRAFGWEISDMHKLLGQARG